LKSAVRNATFAALAVSFAALAQAPARPQVATVPGMPPVADASNLYSEIAAGKVRPELAADLPRVYVPHIQSNDVYVIDPATFTVVGKLKAGLNPQHVVPSWDMRTLWVANNAENTNKGSLMPIDPTTGKIGKAIAVDDPYNMYFSPDGKSAIVVAEAMKRLDFRDPKTMQLQYSIDVPKCAGINHADFSIDGRFAIFTCEFAGTVAKIDMVERKVLGYTQVIQPGRPTKVVKGPDGRDEVICTTWKGMPQDIRASPDGKIFYVADMMADGVHVVDLESFRQVGFIETGKGRTASIPRATAGAFTSPTEGRTRSTAAPRARVACR
jgi:YVTN family beta-propeller protein